MNGPKEKWESNYVHIKRGEREERKTLKDFFSFQKITVLIYLNTCMSHGLLKLPCYLKIRLKSIRAILRYRNTSLNCFSEYFIPKIYIGGCTKKRYALRH